MICPEHDDGTINKVNEQWQNTAKNIVAKMKALKDMKHMIDDESEKHVNDAGDKINAADDIDIIDAIGSKNNDANEKWFWHHQSILLNQWKSMFSHVGKMSFMSIVQPTWSFANLTHKKNCALLW